MTPQEAGYVLGALAGGAIGSAPGAAAGALLGTAAGSLISKPIDAARERKERQGLEDRLNAPATASATAPPLDTTPSVAPRTASSERVWIDEQIIGGRVVPGHFAERAIPAEEEHTTIAVPPDNLTADAGPQSRL